MSMTEIAYMDERAYGVAGKAPQRDTELASLLSTIATQASDIRGAILHICDRVAPQPEEACGDKQCFAGGYVGQAEQIRSTLNETQQLLSHLAKLV